MSKFTVALEYGNKETPDVLVDDGPVRLVIKFDDGTNMIITPDKSGQGRLSIIGRSRKMGMVALSVTRHMGQANRVEVTSRITQKGEG